MLAESAPSLAARTEPLQPLAWPPRKRWTREECQMLETLGLCDHQRLELIEGDFLIRAPQERPHVIAFILMLQWLTQTFEIPFLNMKGPIDVAPHDNPTSEPEPDFAVLTRAATEYTTGNPPPSDVRLLIEIADSTRAFDLGPKARLYARAGIADYWVVDLENRRNHVHRDPKDGIYTTVNVHEDNEVLSPLTAPAALLTVSAVLPPRT